MSPYRTPPLSRALFLVILVVAVPGCTVSPEVSAEALTLGASAALLFRRMLTDGTWPQKWNLPEPWKSLLAAVLGAAAAILTAKVQGASWQAAVSAGLSGLIAVVLGIVEKGLPASKLAATTTPAPTTTTTPPN